MTQLAPPRRLHPASGFPNHNYFSIFPKERLTSFVKRFINLLLGLPVGTAGYFRTPIVVPAWRACLAAAALSWLCTPSSAKPPVHFSCKLPNPEVAVEGKLTVVKAVNTCGFDVTIHFDVRYDSRNGTHHKFRLKKCGGKESWSGPVEWKLSPFTLDYDDTVIVVCK